MRVSASRLTALLLPSSKFRSSFYWRCWMILIEISWGYILESIVLFVLNVKKEALERKNSLFQRKREGRMRTAVSCNRARRWRQGRNRVFDDTIVFLYPQMTFGEYIQSTWSLWLEFFILSILNPTAWFEIMISCPSRVIKPERSQTNGLCIEWCSSDILGHYSSGGQLLSRHFLLFKTTIDCDQFLQAWFWSLGSTFAFYLARKHRHHIFWNHWWLV